MSSWNGLSDGENNDDNILESPPVLLFSAAFNTPRLVGILANGVREVPPIVGEYSEDLYDTL